MTKRELNQRRIAWTTRGLAVAAAVGTGIFAAVAAQHTSEARAQSSGTGTTVVQEEDDDNFSSVLTPSQSTPSQTFNAPVATSAGS